MSVYLILNRLVFLPRLLDLRHDKYVVPVSDQKRYPRLKELIKSKQLKQHKKECANV